MKTKQELHANRRGIVPLHSPSDKPAITTSELIRMRKLGTSYKQIGRKVGIDCHREDVIQVYTALGCKIESVKAPSKVSPPTPLWYLFDSEKELIKDHILPSKTDVKQLLPQNRIASRLGENAGFMLDIYIKVNKIVSEEIQNSFNGASTNSAVGILKKWDGDLGCNLINKVFDIQKCIGQAAYELTDYFEVADVGRCICSASKALRFGWKDESVPHPSFFWGCSRYTPYESSKHDKGQPVRGSFWNVIASEVNVGHISDKNLRLLGEKTTQAIAYWNGRDADEELLKQASIYYGGPEEVVPYKDSKAVARSLELIKDDLNRCLAERVAVKPTEQIENTSESVDV